MHIRADEHVGSFLGGVEFFNDQYKYSVNFWVHRTEIQTNKLNMY